MTVLGKVLVFVNLAFSLAVAFFITQSYAKRTDWARAYTQANDALQKANNQRDQYAKDAQDAATKMATVQTTLNNTIKEKDAAKSESLAVINDLRNQIASKDKQLATRGLTDGAVQTEVQRLSERAQRLEKSLADSNKRLDDQAKSVEDYRQRAVKAEIDNKSLIARNNELLNVVEEKEKELVRLKAAPGGVTTTSAAGTLNPPPGDVAGRVKNYDPTSGLLTITVGSDAGILKGHTLYVYRLEPNGQYVGQMRVTEVRPNEAVGKMINKPRTPIQVNDKVGSKIS